MPYLLISLLILVSAGSVRAEAPPLPGHHPAREIEQQLKDEEAAKKALEKELADLQADIKSGKKGLVGLAADIKRNEAQLSELEARLEKLEAERAAIDQKLGRDRGSLADLMLALERIRRVPPEALIARPGAPLETAQSAMLLEQILPDLYERAEALKADLARLSDIIETIERDKKAIQVKNAALQFQHKEMSGLLDQRQARFEATQGDVKQRDAEIRQISARASNLKDLIKKLDNRRVDKPAPQARRGALPRSGSGQLPVSGIVRGRYGERDEIGARTEGIRIEARHGALVVAPMGGVVRFSGDFRNYGQMVIIEHEHGYHSLVAGLARIDTVVGQPVAAGEPLGVLGSRHGEKPVLYYELQLDGQPINPARKIGDLG